MARIRTRTHAHARARTHTHTAGTAAGTAAAADHAAGGGPLPVRRSGCITAPPSTGNDTERRRGRLSPLLRSYQRKEGDEGREEREGREGRRKERENSLGSHHYPLQAAIRERRIHTPETRGAVDGGREGGYSCGHVTRVASTRLPVCRPKESGEERWREGWRERREGREGEGEEG